MVGSIPGPGRIGACARASEGPLGRGAVLSAAEFAWRARSERERFLSLLVSVDRGLGSSGRACVRSLGRARSCRFFGVAVRAFVSSFGVAAPLCVQLGRGFLARAVVGKTRGPFSFFFPPASPNPARRGILFAFSTRARPERETREKQLAQLNPKDEDERRRTRLAGPHDALESVNHVLGCLKSPRPLRSERILKGEDQENAREKKAPSRVQCTKREQKQRIEGESNHKGVFYRKSEAGTRAL